MIYNNTGASTVQTAAINTKKEISLKIALILSTFLHGFLPLLIYLTLFLLTLLGINLIMFNPPTPKVKDIEFKLVQAPEQKPLQDTKNRADRDTRAGGKHNPNQPESEPQPKASKATPKPAQPAPKPAQKPVKKPQQQTKPQPKPQPQKQPQQQKPQKQPPKPTPPMPIPVTKAPKPSAPPNPLAPPINIPKSNKPVAPSIGNVGPITKNNSSTSESSGPAPVTLNSPTGSSSSGSPGSSARGSSGTRSYGSGNPGNPSAGNPGGAPGINAKRDPDFGPYMADLQRRIKRNWQPPKQGQSKRVILMFAISRDGRLLGLRVQRSSGDPDTDRAAISAVQLSSPFRSLPSDFSGSSIDIQFTFDYNVFGVGGRNF